MILELILALLLGILVGTFTGLSPGIHINLVSSILVSSLPLLLFLPLLSLVVFIVSMSITHTFIDFIPSIYLGAPEEDNFLSVLPGHKMLKQGKAHEAFVLTLYGSLIALPIILIFTPIFALFLPSLYVIIKDIIPFILIFVSCYLIFRDSSITAALITFFLSGILGLLTFNLPVKQPLMPLLTGMFGLSNLFVSIKNKVKIKKQILTPLKDIRLGKTSFFKTFLASSIAAPLCSFLPGIGSGHAAVLGSEMIDNKKQSNHDSNKSFLFLVGAINTIVMALSFVTAYSIEKTRTGSAAAVQQILGKIQFTDLIIIIITIIFSSIIAFFLGLQLSKLASKFINKINYSYLTISIILILLLINLIFSNWLGFLVLLTGTAIGVFTILSGNRRINLMGSLILPSIIYYLMN